MKNLQIFGTLTIFLLLAIFASYTYYNASSLKEEVRFQDDQITQLEEQLEHLQGSNSSLLDRLSDLSLISKTGADNISKSLENISQQYSFIEDLTTKVQFKDSLNTALMENLKRSLDDFDDEDVQIEVKGSIVHVSISDQLLFDVGSSAVSSEAKDVLDKLASIINDHSDLQVMVEGHTDAEPIKGGCMNDNWDLSVKRATSIVRLLQEDYFVDPARMTAAGRGEYIPIVDNDTEIGRSQNRRTEVIMTPKLDQFFALLESPVLQN